MRLSALMFLLGILVFQQLEDRPPFPVIWLVPLVLPALFAAPLRPFAMLLAGFVWIGMVAGDRLDQRLDPALEGRDLTIEGVVSTIPVSLKHASRFALRITDWPDGRGLQHPHRLRLAWYGKVPDLRAGQRWRLKVRLKRPHGFMNPGGFRYEDWLFRRGIGATGYVRPADANRLLGRSERIGDRIQALREDLFEALMAATPDDPMRGMVAALAMGERQGIERAQWNTLTRTGTSHLVAISGLHVGLVAGGGYTLCLFLWSRVGRWSLRFPAQRAAAVGGFLASLVYATLAGFSLPTQRALIMVGVAMAGILARRRPAAGDTLALALLAVLIRDPLAVMSPGFWLSFGAVFAIMISVRHRTHHPGLWWRWGRIHFLLAIALTPALAHFFQSVPILAPIANLFAVPWVAFVVVPLTLAGMVFLVLGAPFGASTLHLAAWAMGALWQPLSALAKVPSGQWMPGGAAPWSLIPAVLAVILILLPRGTPGRSLSLILLIPLALHRPERLVEGAFRLDLLDVGQGLAAVVRTRDHVLVYDTGPRFGSGLDAARVTILPYLVHEGIDDVDTLVISHGDRDHAGGLATLFAAIPIRRVVTGIPGGLEAYGSTPCERGDRWTWNGVAFAFLHPAPDYVGRGNDRSCVLRVGPPGRGALLPGDIEASAESALLDRDRGALRARVIVAPHHGSTTSSTEPFLQAVAPELALFPVGYRNRFGFPRPEILERYRRLGIGRRDTARSGTIRLDFSPRGEIARVVSHRDSIRRYWHWRPYFNDPD